jgi:hypothetical protein
MCMVLFNYVQWIIGLVFASAISPPWWCALGIKPGYSDWNTYSRVLPVLYLYNAECFAGGRPLPSAWIAVEGRSRLTRNSDKFPAWLCSICYPLKIHPGNFFLQGRPTTHPQHLAKLRKSEGRSPHLGGPGVYRWDGWDAQSPEKGLGWDIRRSIYLGPRNPQGKK